MEEKKETTEIVIASGEYMEAYAPFPGTKEENEQKVKRGILARLGMKQDEIDKLINSVEIEFDNGGADGTFDDGPYTPIKLVKKIYKEPNIDIDFESDLNPEKNPEINKPRQTMLQQYYGDKKAEDRRNKIFDRFKSHVIQKEIDVYDEDGNKRKIKVYTIEDYEGKEKDSNELLLDGYQTRLERLSRAHQRDFSPYKREFQRLRVNAIKEIMQRYEEMHEIDPKQADEFKKEAIENISKFKDPEFEKKAIQALIDKDTEFIETNNYTYNSRQNTAENLKTMGKDGEKSVKAQISDEQSNLQKAGLKTMNFFINIRNHTRVPINKSIGTYVTSPIYRALMKIKQPKSKEPVSVDGYFITPIEDMLATSQKHSRGMFKNKQSHRYHARKDYFIAREKEKMKSQEGVPKVTVGQLIKLAIIPRVNAIVKYKEGNKAILNAGLHDIEMATDERHTQMSQKRHTIIDCMKRIASYEKEIEDLKSLEKVTKDLENKENIEQIIKQRELCKLKLEGRLAETERIEIDSVSTDAVSMSQHDKANKANMSTVVRGFKIAAKAAISTYISKYLYEEVAHQAKTPDKLEYIPGETKEIEKRVNDTITEFVPGMDKADVKNITLEDIYSKGSGLLTYDAYGGRQIEDKTSFFRGLAFELEGKLCSGSDGKGFDPTVLTDVQLNQTLDNNTTVVSLIQEIIQDKYGKQIPTDEISDMIISGKISGIDIWRSTSKDGVPMGWLNASEIVPEMVNSGTHEITKEVTKSIKEVVTSPGKYILRPGVEYEYATTELNPVVLAAELGLTVSEISDLNEFLRFTRSQESIQRRQPKLIRLMAEENARKMEEKAPKEKDKKQKIHVRGTSEKDIIPIEKKRKIKSFQRSNKSKTRYYEHHSKKMTEYSKTESKKRKGVTVFEGFIGTKKDDFTSGYDENLIGVNDTEQPIEEERY